LTSTSLRHSPWAELLIGKSDGCYNGAGRELCSDHPVDSISSRSRRSASKQPVEAMATQLESQAAEGCAVSRTSVVMPAYWAVPPWNYGEEELVNAVIGRLGFCHTFFPEGSQDRSVG